jgi:selenocysteine-specific elongation factor
MGVPPHGASATSAGAVAVGDWLVEPEHWAALRARLVADVTRYGLDHPLESGMPVDALRRALDLPDRALVEALVQAPCALDGGRVRLAARSAADLPPRVALAVTRLREDLTARPFAAPDAARLADLGLEPKAIGAAVRAGALVRVAAGIVLLPGAVESAVDVLARLPQPFTLSEARQALDTTRRVAVPLLELLDQRGATRRLPDDRREIVSR